MDEQMRTLDKGFGNPSAFEKSSRSKVKVRGGRRGSGHPAKRPRAQKKRRH